MFSQNLIEQNLTLVFGFFGAGKTFYTVQEAYKAYKKGDIVISNMWLAFPHIRWYTADQLPPIIREVQKYHDNIATPRYAPNSYRFAHKIPIEKGKTRKFFFLIDEGAIFFNARNFKKNFENPDIIEFFVQPRKFDCSIALIVQSLEMLDVNFRRLAQEVVELRKGFLGLLRLGESYDTKYINFNGDGFTPDIPIARRKIFFHNFYTMKSKFSFFGGLYYTKEILGERAIRIPEHIRSLEQYFFKEKHDKKFHDWLLSYKLAKQQIFGLTEKQAQEDEKNAHKNDK